MYILSLSLSLIRKVFLHKDYIRISSFFVQCEENLAEKFKAPQDLNSILVCTLYFSLKALPKDLKDISFTVLAINTQIVKLFTSKPSVAFRKIKIIRNHVVTKINQIL